MFEYENVYFNWFEDIRGYKYFLQSLQLNVCSRNLFLCRYFETSSDLFFRRSLWFGYMSIANYWWSFFVFCAFVGYWYYEGLSVHPLDINPFDPFRRTFPINQFQYLSIVTPKELSCSFFLHRTYMYIYTYFIIFHYIIYYTYIYILCHYIYFLFIAIYIYICTYILYIYIYTHIYIYIHIYVCVYIYMCIYIYIYYFVVLWC